MEVFEEEVEIYNSKMRLLSWIYEELKIQPDQFKETINEQGQKLSLNI